MRIVRAHFKSRLIHFVMATENTVQLYFIGFYEDLTTSLVIQYKVPKRVFKRGMSLSVLLRKKPYGFLIFERKGRGFAYNSPSGIPRAL